MKYPAGEPLTHEEYIARGMLLGMNYNWETHMYIPPKDGSKGKPHGFDSIWLDADTLEPMDHAARNKIRKTYFKPGINRAGVKHKGGNWKCITTPTKTI